MSNDSSLCPNCGSYEFEILESSMGSSSVLATCCSLCGHVMGAKADKSPSKDDDIVAKVEKLMGDEVGSFKVVSIR